MKNSSAGRRGRDPRGAGPLPTRTPGAVNGSVGAGGLSGPGDLTAAGDSAGAGAVKAPGPGASQVAALPKDDAPGAPGEGPGADAPRKDDSGKDDAGRDNAGRRAPDRGAPGVRAVAVAVTGQVWPLLALLGLFQAAGLAHLARSGDGVPAAMAWSLLKPAALGLVASFVLHEAAHVVLLRRIPTVTRVVVTRTAWRTSVIPEGPMTPRQTARVAVAGPASCVLVGVLLLTSGVDRALSWWYLAHALFLLPCFGDGRTLLHTARQRTRGRGTRG